MKLVGQEHKTVLDESRMIQCGACTHAMTIAQADQAGGHCPKCGERMCVFCGCTERSPCLGEAGPCFWHRPGLCNYCFGQVAEAKYIEIENDLASGKLPNVQEQFELYKGEPLQEIKPFKVPTRPTIL